MKHKTVKTHVSKKKIKSVKELNELIKSNKTVLIASIKNIPASQFQEISKKLRDKAVIKVPKRNLIGRVLDSVKEEKLEGLKKKIDDSVAIIFSNLDPFDLALELVQSKSAARAKAGQIAPEEIEVSAGPTDLVPGPAISELGALGIQITIDKGKLNIKQAKVIAKKGEAISKGAVEVMNKLGIMPFKSGFIPLAAFDLHSKQLYSEISINPEETLEILKDSFGKALALTVSIGLTNKETIGFLLAKAASHETALGKFADNIQEEIKSGETA
jgi:large subunit ribosomal protein L10